MKIGFTDVLPTASNAYTLFDSSTNGYLNAGIKRVAVTIYHDEAGTLVASVKMPSGQWRVYYSEPATGSTSTALTGPVDFLVDTFDAWKLEWVNGGVDQTVFEVSMHGLESRLVGN